MLGAKISDHCTSNYVSKKTMKERTGMYQFPNHADYPIKKDISHKSYHIMQQVFMDGKNDTSSR